MEWGEQEGGGRVEGEREKSRLNIIIFILPSYHITEMCCRCFNSHVVLVHIYGEDGCDAEEKEMCVYSNNTIYAVV